MKMARRSPSCRVTCCQHLSPLLCTGVSVMHVLFYLNHLRVHYMHCDPSLLKAAAVFPEHRCILSHTHNTAVMSGSASTLVCNVPSICILFELTQQCPLAPCCICLARQGWGEPVVVRCMHLPYLMRLF